MYNFQAFKEKLKGVETWLSKELQGVRTGRASISFLDPVKVESYGSLVPLNQVATISLEDARVIRIAPWDTALIKDVEKAIIASNLGVSAAVDDKGVRVIFPDLTGERRTELAKMAKAHLEEGKTSVRRLRDEVMKDIQGKEAAGGVSKDDVFKWKQETQKYVDETTKRLEESFQKKEKEITTI